MFLLNYTFWLFLVFVFIGNVICSYGAYHPMKRRGGRIFLIGLCVAVLATILGVILNGFISAIIYVPFLLITARYITPTISYRVLQKQGFSLPKTKLIHDIILRREQERDNTNEVFSKDIKKALFSGKEPPERAYAKEIASELMKNSSIREKLSEKQINNDRIYLSLKLLYDYFGAIPINYVGHIINKTVYCDLMLKHCIEYENNDGMIVDLDYETHEILHRLLCEL